jgi:LmbE family N-acetylglucosaminyl deacetylase
MPHLKQWPKPDLLGLVHYGKVALLGGMLAAGSVMVVAAHSADSSAAVVAASEHWISASGATAVALASTAGSSTAA